MHTPQKSYKQFTLPKQLQHFSSSSSLIKPIPKNYECILFPTYAKRSSEDPNKWVIRVKGWALSLKSPGPKQKVLKGITKSVAGKRSNNELSNKMFENRFKYFLANGKGNRQFYIETTHAIDKEPLKHWSKLEYNIEPKKTSTINATTPSLSSSSSTTETKSVPKQAAGTVMVSENNGVFSGELHVSNSESLFERIIKIKSLDLSEKESCYFPTSYGLVNLIEPNGISVISDIDDTIKCTKVLAGARTVLINTFFNPTCAVPGMAETYSQWYRQGASFHYVSNSPFQLTHMLNKFRENHEFPPGSFHLRESTGLISKIVPSKPGHSKYDSICGILRDFPHRKFILVGDSGEIDLEIYTRVATEFPNQIIKIFIRDVTSMLHYQTKRKRSYRASLTHKSSSFPSFFSSNRSTPLSSPTVSQPTTDDEEEDAEEEEEILEETSKIVELVLEPTLTGHHHVSSPVHHDVDPFTTTTATPSHPPLSQNLMQLHTRLSHARGLLKDIEIALFKDAKELSTDEKVCCALHL
ncbi:hypothetical protein BD770DRAFT_387988 [Pilaira anomala]|nr:hypothetical protein BD770DRAFT_387988 [Pilaira anomala]